MMRNTGLVTTLVDLAVTASYKRPRKQPEPSNSNRGRGIKRKLWVSEDDTLTHRSYGGNHRKSNWQQGRGQNPQRGRGARGGGKGGQTPKFGGGSNAGRWNSDRRGNGRFSSHTTRGAAEGCTLTKSQSIH
jgi:hypothetical protein